MRNWKKVLASACAGVICAGSIPASVYAASLAKGDLDGDGNVTIMDAYNTLIAYSKTSAGLSSGLSEAQKTAADVDGDGNVTITDAYQILLYYSTKSAGGSPDWNHLSANAGWQNAYADFLQNGDYLSYFDNGWSDPYKFTIAYIDNDSIPELLVTNNSCHAAGLMIATYYQGRVMVLSHTNAYGTSYGFGSYGAISYLPKQNLFNSSYYGMGVGTDDVYSISQGKAVLQDSLGIDRYDQDNPTYYINDTKVSKANYQAKCSAYSFSSMITIGYDNMADIQNTDINAYITGIPDALSASQLRSVRKNLGVPDNLSVTYTQSDPWWWEGAGIWLTTVSVMHNGEIVASAAVDSHTAELARSISMYSD